MSRVVVMAAVLALLPPACAKLMGKQPPSVEPDVPVAPPLPVTSATAPPVWRAPESNTSAAAAGASSAAPPANTDLVKARAATEQKEFKKVRALLEKKVRGGNGVPEESQLLLRACTALKDKACIAEVRAKHGEDLTE